MSGHVSQDRAILSAFYTQYVALLLIVLSALIGSGTRSESSFPELTDGVPQTAPALEPRRLVDVEITHQRLPDDLFSLAGDVVTNSAMVSAFASIAREHDVRLEFFLPSLPGRGDSRVSDRQLRTLDEFLVHQGVPPHAFRIWRTSRSEAHGPHVTAYRQRWRGSAG
jgi:hypothetical protein